MFPQSVHPVFAQHTSQAAEQRIQRIEQIPNPFNPLNPLSSFKASRMLHPPRLIDTPMTAQSCAAPTAIFPTDRRRCAAPAAQRRRPSSVDSDSG